MLDDGSTPVIIKIDGDEVGSCFTIQNFMDIPKTFCPEIPLQFDSVKDTNWAKANKDIALVILPTLAPLPFGADIKSIALDDDFVEEMKMLSFKHGFWEKMMINAHDQYATDFDTGMVVKNLITSNQTSATRDPCQAAMKGLRNVSHAISGPIVDTSCPGKSYECEQNKIKEFSSATQRLRASKSMKTRSSQSSKSLSEVQLHKMSIRHMHQILHQNSTPSYSRR
jgi:hypothetical protein